MQIELTAEQTATAARARAFALERIAPEAGRWDREERFPREMIAQMAAEGFVGAVVPAEHGGPGLDPVSVGLVHAAIGGACSSARSLLTVHSMFAQTLLRWGSAEARERWLPAVAKGERIGAFALSEPEVGSDAQSITTEAERVEGGYRLRGTKRWITFGQLADLFLVFARVDHKPTAFFVEAGAEGLSIEPIGGLLGMRASMLATLRFDDVHVDTSRRVGGEGFGISVVGSGALDLGRYSVAWGAVGAAEACVEASIAYANSRQQFGSKISELQLIRRMLTNMAVETRAARLLCLEAGWLRQRGSGESVTVTQMAKYFASRAAFRVASDAVQIHGANGVTQAHPVERMLRDSKINEIVEGSTEIQQILIGKAVAAQGGKRS